MADYDTYPDELSVSDISYEELILSDIIAKDVPFPARRIFASMSSIFFSQHYPNITGKSNGDDVGNLTTNAGHAPITFAFASGTGDDDNGDFSISNDTIVWNSTPSTDARTTRVLATDANGIEVEGIVQIFPYQVAGSNCWSGGLDATPGSEWTVITNNNCTISYPGVGTKFDTIAFTANADYQLQNNFGGISNGNTFLLSLDYSNTANFNSSPSPNEEVVARIIVDVGGTTWTWSCSVNENGAHAPYSVLYDGSSYVYFQVTSDTSSGTLSIERDGSDSLIFTHGINTYTATVGSYPNNSGTLNSIDVQAKYDFAGAFAFSTTLSNFVIESPTGTPYCT